MMAKYQWEWGTPGLTVCKSFSVLSGLVYDTVGVSDSSVWNCIIICEWLQYILEEAVMA